MGYVDDVSASTADYSLSVETVSVCFGTDVE